MLWFIFSLAVLIGILFMITLYIYKLCFYSPKRRADDPFKQMSGEEYENVQEHIDHCTGIIEGAPCQTVEIKSHDGITLAGRYYHTKDTAPLQIMFHGYRSHASRDCSGGYMLAKKMGFNVLVVDQRAHRKSGGRTISFGILERKDCLNWIRFAQNRFGEEKPIILSGLSMGAATVLMAASLPLPRQVVAIMADCPYSSPGGIIQKVTQDLKYPPKLLYPLIRLSARIYGGFSLEECTARNAVSQTKIPILLIHGENDTFVPCEMSREIFEACRDHARLYTFPDAGHGLCYMTDPERYEYITIAFLASVPELKDHIKESSYAETFLKEHAGQFSMQQP